MIKNISSLLTFTPAIRNYVWGGRALLPIAGPEAEKNDDPIAEVWALHEDNPVNNGIFAGHTLAELVAEYPDSLPSPWRNFKYGKALYQRNNLLKL